MKKHNFKIELSDSFADDVKEAIQYYNEKQKDLGIRFYDNLKAKLKSLKKDAFLYQIKYDNFRCLKVAKFPYLIHYELNEKNNTVFVHAVICTYKDVL
ncbi:MAG: type II toxin-antitoxin system RelE/ParE family toxin [Bacteroidota bacterium]